jgi:hypothetical protein
MRDRQMTKSSAGVLARAEIIPLEPDPGNAGVGRKKQIPLSYALTLHCRSIIL